MGSSHEAAVHRALRLRIESAATQATNGALATWGPIVVGSVAAPHPLLNTALIYAPPEQRQVKQAFEWMNNREEPFYIWVADKARSAVERNIASIAYEHDATLPGMILPSLKELPAIETTASVREVADPENGEKFWTVFREVFEIPQEPQLQDMMVESVLSDQTRAFLGTVDGDIAVTGAIFETEEIANVWGIATRESFRNRGLATAITLRTLQTARDDACQMATLEAAPEAVSLYERLGFEAVVNYHLFRLTE